MGDLTVTWYKKLTEHYAELVEGGDGVTGYKRLLYGYYTVIKGYLSGHVSGHSGE